ncbi:MAG: hypothetical protein JEZ06_18560 [Anaerolineaceae bacterium]|nr:hypothetical protein [Anaerolineaceae bacterium]
MIVNWETGQELLRTISQILTAGVSIMAFSLFLNMLTFNLKDRIVRLYGLILICVVIVFTSEALGSIVNTVSEIDFWLRLEWVGIMALPAIYLHFTYAIIATTGQNSLKFRKWVVGISYILAVVSLLSLQFSDYFNTGTSLSARASQYEPNIITVGFSAFYILSMFISWMNLYTAYQRTMTPTSRRRMQYLALGSLAPALGSFPYMLFGYGFAEQNQTIFWIVAILSNFLVGFFLILMAYSVAFYGVAWPDRVVRRRLIKWILRGPFIASLALALTTFVRRIGEVFGFVYTALVPIIMILTVLIGQYLISIFGPILERRLFYGRDKPDLDIIDSLENRLLTRKDLEQFLELVLASICDRLQARGGFVAGLDDDSFGLVVTLGENRFDNQDENVSEELSQMVSSHPDLPELFKWGNDIIMPLVDHLSEEKKMVGLLGITNAAYVEVEENDLFSLTILMQRAATALKDRYLQQEIFKSFQTITPEVELIQQMRAVGRYDESKFMESEKGLPEDEISQWVKDALTHYWGGPRLTENPLLSFLVVQESLEQHKGSRTNALRSILREAIGKVKPDGDRKFTAEWILYNILEMRFLEGRKVREIAARLAMSEADLYRKQRIAVEEVAKGILEMESIARNQD